MREINENIADLKKDSTRHPLKIKNDVGICAQHAKEVEQDILLYEMDENRHQNPGRSLFGDLPSLLIEYKIKSESNAKRVCRTTRH